MEYLAYILFALLCVRALVALCNLIFRHSLPTKYVQRLEPTPSLSILIPARDEESNLPNILEDIRKLSYPVSEVIIYDDLSTDNTSKIIDSYSSLMENLKHVKGKSLPSGWFGKMHACHNLYLESKGDILLFIDADVRLSQSSVCRAVNYMLDNDLQLLSIFPTQLIKGRENAITIPIMSRILLSLLPLILVRRCSWSSFSAANGQFMMFRREQYKANEPHKKFKQSRAEDIEIAKMYKRERYKISTLCGGNDIKCHMYNSYNEAKIGFSKNVLHFFGNSSFAAIVYFIVTTVTLPVLILFANLYIIVFAFIITIGIRVTTSIIAGESVRMNISSLLSQQLFLGRILFISLKNKKRGELLWKGRKI